MYNCTATYIDRPRVFQEIVWLLLCGCGVGFSIQAHHIAKLPDIASINKADRMVFCIPDSIEGWSDAVGILISSYFDTETEFHDYKGKEVKFVYSKRFVFRYEIKLGKES